MEKWTIELLKNTDNIDFAICILNERKNKLTNIYSPLSKKISQSIALLQLLESAEIKEMLKNKLNHYNNYDNRVLNNEELAIKDTLGRINELI